MPIDPAPYLDPSKCCIVNMECQENLIGPDSVLPGLAESAKNMGLVDNLAKLFESGRKAGTQLYYCTDERRSDGFGAETNTFVRMRMDDEGGAHVGGHGQVVDPIQPRPEDVVFRREQGLTGFASTGLDAYLRNTGVTTVIVTGVSLNIAVLGTALEAMNLGYWVIVPSDCVASDPAGYAEHVLRYTIRNIALVTDSDAIIKHWDGRPG